MDVNERLVIARSLANMAKLESAATEVMKEGQSRVTLNFSCGSCIKITCYTRSESEEVAKFITDTFKEQKK